MTNIKTWIKGLGSVIGGALVCAILAWGTPAWADDTYAESGTFAYNAHSKGNWRVAGGGEVSHEIVNAGAFGLSDGESYGGQTSVGYFIAHNWEIGVKSDGRSLNDTGGGYWFNIDAFLKYYWTRDRRLTPYVGVQGGAAIVHVDGFGTNVGANLGVIAGFEVMLSERAAFFAEYNGTYTSDFDPGDVYGLSTTGVVGFALYF